MYWLEKLDKRFELVEKLNEVLEITNTSYDAILLNEFRWAGFPSQTYSGTSDCRFFLKREEREIDGERERFIMKAASFCKGALSNIVLLFKL